MNQKSIIAVLGVVVVILIGTTVYFVTTNKTSQPVESAPKVVQQPTPAPAPAAQKPAQPTTPTPQPIDETVNWQTYTSAQYGFTFKYPSDFVKSSDVASFPGYTGLAAFENKSDLFIEVGIEGGVLDSSNIQAPGVPGAKLDPKYVTKLKVDGKDALRYVKGDGGNVGETVLVGLNGKKISLALFGSLGNDNKKVIEIKSTLDKIVSTFKFTK